MTDAARLVVSYPADLSRWGRLQLDTHHFRAYLRRRPDAAPGDEWPVFLDVGCCGDSLDVPLRVEAVALDTGETIDDPGADGERYAITDDTAIAYVEREACGIAGGWLVQSAADETGRRRADSGADAR